MFKELVDAIKKKDTQKFKDLWNANPDSLALADKKDDSGFNFLYWACCVESVDIVNFLLEKKASVFTVCPRGRTPLHWAAHNGFADGVAILLEAHSDINARDNEGFTPLHLAACQGVVETTRLLLDHGVDTRLVDNNRKKPSDIATKETKKIIIGHQLTEEKLEQLLQSSLTYLQENKWLPYNESKLPFSIIPALLTTLLYESRRCAWGDESYVAIKNFFLLLDRHTKLVETYSEEERIFFGEIKAVLIGPQEPGAQKTKLGLLLSEIEKESGTFYGSYLSDDSDSDEEKTFVPNSVQGKHKLVLAESHKERSQHAKFFFQRKSGDKSKGDLKINAEVDLDLQAGKKIQRNLDFSRKIETIKRDLDTLNKRLRSDEDIAEAIKNLPTKFYVAQYRGIHYRTSQWGQAARRVHRRLDETKQPVYSASVYAAAGALPFHRFYKKTDEQRQVVERTFDEKAKELQTNLLSARRSGAVTYAVPNTTSYSYTYDSIAHMLQNIYTSDYKKFHELICHKSFSDMLLNNHNPFVSTGNVPSHALRYAYGVKYYDDNDAKDERLRPRWQAGRAERPYSGKVYISLHALTDYGANGPLDVIALNRAGKISVINNIVFEAERSFSAYMEANRVFETHIAKYPSFHGPYKNIYLYKYGLDKNMYDKFQAAILNAKPHTVEAKGVKDLLSEWLCAYHEVRLIAAINQHAEEQGGVLVYLHQDGSFNLEPEENAKLGMPPGKDNSALRETIQMRRDLRKLIVKHFLPAQDNIFRPIDRVDVEKCLSKSVGEHLGSLLDEIFKIEDRPLETLLQEQADDSLKGAFSSAASTRSTGLFVTPGLQVNLRESTGQGGSNTLVPK